MSRIFIILYGVICFFILLNRQIIWKDKMFGYDKSGYHIYLPAAFIYNDLKHLDFYQHIHQVYRPGGDDEWYSISLLPNGNRLNKYPIGVSLLDIPFFLAAHLYTIVTDTYAQDGYSLPYQFATSISTIFWACIGLFYLRKFLLHTYNHKITFAVLVAVSFGTNLYFYTAFDQGMSHPYSFFLFAAALYYTDAWYRKHIPTYAYLLSIILGLIVITRPTDGLVLIIILLWKVNSFTTLKKRLNEWWEYKSTMLISVMLFSLILLIQMAYWKYVSGQWIYYSYSKEHFLFTEPEIVKGLIGFRKGWYIYTPLAFIASLGFINLWYKDKKMVPVLLIFLLAIIYVTFSWWNWWYGGGFGCRPLIDILPIMCIPFAVLLYDIYNCKSLVVKIVCSSILCMLIALNVFQTYQAAKLIIAVDKMTAEYYWRVFLKTERNEAYEQYLLNDKEYWDGYKRIDR